MRTSKHILKITPHFSPFTDSYLDIDTVNMQFNIGNNSEFEENVFEDEESPQYIQIICELSPLKTFSPKAQIHTTYHAMPSDPNSIRHITKNIYDGSVISLNKLVSGLEIKYKTIVPSIPLAEKWHNFLSEQYQNLYTKQFLTISDKIDIIIEPDQRYDKNAYNNIISRAYPIAGLYHKGIPINDIEQYFVYYGTGIQAKEYIKLVSSKELFSSKHLKIAPGIKASSITSLEDDVSLGKIEIISPNETKYQSISITKNTVLSNVCTITFQQQN